MATPTVATTNTGGGNSNGASIPLPTGISSGDGLLVIVNANGQTVTTPGGWNLLISADMTASSLNGRIYAFTRDADGSEGTTLSVSFSGNAKWSSIAYRITGAHTVANWGAAATSTTSAAVNQVCDCPNLAMGSSADHLWIAFYGALNTFTQTSTPTGYSGLLTSTSTGGGSANSKSTSASWRKGTTATSSEDPPSVTINSGIDVGHIDFTVGVPPPPPPVVTVPKRIRFPVGMTQAVHRAAVR